MAAARPPAYKGNAAALAARGARGGVGAAGQLIALPFAGAWRGFCAAMLLIALRLAGAWGGFGAARPPTARRVAALRLPVGGVGRHRHAVVAHRAAESRCHRGAGCARPRRAGREV